MANYTAYRVKQGDTLQALAAMFLGDVARWGELATLNRLRSPYLSDDPIQRYGFPLWNGTLPLPLPAGATTYTHPGLDPMLAQPGTLFYVERLTTNGAQGEALELRSYVPATPFAAPVAGNTFAVAQGGGGAAAGLLTFATAAQADYPETAYCALVVDPPPGSYTVLATGDTLYLPGLSAASGVAGAAARGMFVDLFGQDLRLSNGALVAANGDLAVVGGVANLAQALTLRFLVEQGTLRPHPTYGNALGALVGKSLTGSTLTLAAASAVQATATDPRVARVAVRQIQLLAPDTVGITVDVTAVGSAEAVALHLPFTLAGGTAGG